MARKKKTTEDGAQEQVEAQGISKTEAARQVIADGVDQPQAAVAEIKDRFGIDLKPQHFSNIKTQLKKRQAAPKGKRGRKAAPTELSAPVATNGSVDLL